MSFFEIFFKFNLSLFIIFLSEIKIILFLNICLVSWPFPAIRIISFGSAFKIAVFIAFDLSLILKQFLFFTFFIISFLIFEGFSFLGLSSVTYIFLKF